MAMRAAALALGVALAGVCALAQNTGATADAIYARTAEEKLARDFTSPDTTYLLYDMQGRRLMAAHWPGREKAVPVGSLVKPFTALAYAEAHGYRFPEHVCRGGHSCWLPKGHGSVGIREAIEFSCNAYFAELARQTSATEVAAVARRYGLEGPPESATAEGMTGMHGEWKERPEALVRAYARLLESAAQAGVREIAQGMAGAGRQGTAALLGAQPMGVLAKTGTAPCIHAPRAMADGWVLVSWPGERPRYVLLVREHGMTGARCAAVAGKMLRELEP